VVTRAEYRTTCASCGQGIEPGDPIVPADVDEWIHADCAEDTLW
jgi:hypothetical protein